MMTPPTPTLAVILDISEPERDEIRALSAAVYPPRVVDDWPGRHIEWSRPDHCVRLWDDDGALVSYTGALLREGAADGAAVKIGGIGGVMTHPEARRRGFAGQCIGEAVRFFDGQGADFGVLVCAPRLLKTYGKLGWRLFEGRLDVLQNGVREPFVFNKVMVRDIGREAPTTGVIDLKGPPW